MEFGQLGIVIPTSILEIDLRIAELKDVFDIISSYESSIPRQTVIENFLTAHGPEYYALLGAKKQY